MVVPKLFINNNCSITQIVHIHNYKYHVGYQLHYRFSTVFLKNVFSYMEIIPMKNQEKKVPSWQSIISLVPKGFYKMCGLQKFGTLMICKYMYILVRIRYEYVKYFFLLIYCHQQFLSPSPCKNYGSLD